MGTENPKAGGLNQPPPRPRTQLSNEKSGVSDKRLEVLKNMAIDRFEPVCDAIKERTALVKQSQDQLTETEASKLMSNVQQAQRNLTEALNLLASYRKAVSLILETRRREAAAVRKQAAKESRQPRAPEPLDATPIEQFTEPLKGLEIDQ